MSNELISQFFLSCNWDISSSLVYSSLFLHCCLICLWTGTFIANSTDFHSCGFSCESMAKRYQICAYHSCVQQPAVWTLSLIQTIDNHFTLPTDRQHGQILCFSSDQLTLHACIKEPVVDWAFGINPVDQWTNRAHGSVVIFRCFQF